MEARDFAMLTHWAKRFITSPGESDNLDSTHAQILGLVLVVPEATIAYLTDKVQSPQGQRSL